MARKKPRKVTVNEVLSFKISLLYYGLFCLFIKCVSDDLIVSVENTISTQGFSQALFWGMLAGIPYKLYAFWAGYLEYSFLIFLFTSVIVRMFRFTIITFGAYLVVRFLEKYLEFRTLYIAHAFCWCVFYIFYFYKMGW